MTDKLQDVVALPEWQERWISDHELFGCIDAGLVRAFLAQYVLCDKGQSYVIHADGHPVVVSSPSFRVELLPGDTILYRDGEPIHAPAKGPGQ